MPGAEVVKRLVPGRQRRAGGAGVLHAQAAGRRDVEEMLRPAGAARGHEKPVLA